MKRIVTSLLLLTLLLAMAIVPGYAQAMPAAEWADKSQASNSEPLDEILVDAVARDVNPPSRFWDLSQSDYHGGGNIEFWTYTRYYFSPNSDGEIYVEATFDWGPEWANNPFKGMSIECVEAKFGPGDTRVDERHIDKDTDSLGRMSSGRICFSGLDPDKYYYFGFTKTRDGEQAELDVEISH